MMRQCIYYDDKKRKEKTQYLGTLRWEVPRIDMVASNYMKLGEETGECSTLVREW